MARVCSARHSRHKHDNYELTRGPTLARGGGCVAGVMCVAGLAVGCVSRTCVSCADMKSIKSICAILISTDWRDKTLSSSHRGQSDTVSVTRRHGGPTGGMSGPGKERDAATHHARRPGTCSLLCRAVPSASSERESAAAYAPIRPLLSVPGAAPLALMSLTLRLTFE